MKHFRNILVYADTDSGHTEAADAAARAAAEAGGRVKLVDVIEELPVYLRLPAYGYPALSKTLIEEKKKKLEILAAPLRERELPVETAVLEGKRFEAIIREVLLRGHDVVVKTGEGGDGAKLFGTTGMRLLRYCPCAVWLIQPVRRRVKRILAAVDPVSDYETAPELNARILSLAAELARAQAGELNILHVWNAFGGGYVHGRAQLSEKQLQTFVKASRKRARAAFEEFLEANAEVAEEAERHLVEGDPPLMIREFAQRRRIDTVVMGTVVRSGLAGFVIGNTAEQVAAHLNCSLLAVKPKGFVSPVKLEDAD